VARTILSPPFPTPLSHQSRNSSLLVCSFLFLRLVFSPPLSSSLATRCSKKLRFSLVFLTQASGPDLPFRTPPCFKIFLCEMEVSQPIFFAACAPLAFFFDKSLLPVKIIFGGSAFALFRPSSPSLYFSARFWPFFPPSLAFTMDPPSYLILPQVRDTLSLFSFDASFP